MAYKFVYVIFFVYLCTRKGLETSRHSLALTNIAGTDSAKKR